MSPLWQPPRLMDAFRPPFFLRPSARQVTAFALGAWLLAGNATLRAAEPQKLTLADARAAAVRTHPRIAAGDARARAARETLTQARANYFPTLTANFTATGSADQNNTRIGASGTLSTTQVYDHAAIGINASQLLTDFGRTEHQVEATRQKSVVEDMLARAVRRQIELQVSVAYFTVLQAQSVRDVARQTLATRELVLQQVSALAKHQSKSELDVSFIRVSVEEARLLLARALSELESGHTELSLLLGDREPRRYELAEEPLPADLTEDVTPLVSQALGERPRLIRLRAELAAATAQARADHALHYPTVSAIGGVGLIPVRDRRLHDNYAAGGLMVNLPLFGGGRDTARQRESEFKAQAAAENLRDEENNIIRDVRVAYLKAQHAHERLDLTAKLLLHARTAHELATAHYKLGASSITELSQAQFNLTSAQIAEATSKYGYLLQRAVLDFHRGAH